MSIYNVKTTSESEICLIFLRFECQGITLYAFIWKFHQHTLQWVIDPIVIDEICRIIGDFNIKVQTYIGVKLINLKITYMGRIVCGVIGWSDFSCTHLQSEGLSGYTKSACSSFGMSSALYFKCIKQWLPLTALSLSDIFYRFLKTISSFISLRLITSSARTWLTLSRLYRNVFLRTETRRVWRFSFHDFQRYQDVKLFLLVWCVIERKNSFRNFPHIISVVVFFFFSLFTSNDRIIFRRDLINFFATVIYCDMKYQKTNFFWNSKGANLFHMPVQ